MSQVYTYYLSKNAADGDDFFTLLNVIARIAQIYTDYLGKMRTRMGMIFFTLLNVIARIAQIYTDYLGKMRTRMGMIFFYSGLK